MELWRKCPWVPQTSVAPWPRQETQLEQASPSVLLPLHHGHHYKSKLQTAETTNENYYLTAYFAASTATLITDVPAALEAALTAAWHAVGLTVGPAVVLDALATCNATCTPTFIGCFFCRAYSCCRPADADATTESIKHVLCFNSQCNRYTQWYCSCCCHWLRLSLPLLP